MVKIGCAQCLAISHCEWNEAISFVSIVLAIAPATINDRNPIARD
ncbi:hypothetical protein [Roseofilum casamattae]|uniref:Uncharacterized protein n=1 Tax=Roseofilum casamattae BLCC-M143 TaxID=3022442 RepID=A0ABT7C2S8_9CYAN|nr:hypothetical protein [Roseofilum casamattae]MDJ1185731.1 hypothetical protein [Roseofilum casamattae BLCC-M143]